MRRSISRYILPFVSTAAALGLRMLLDPILESRIPYATFYVAVTFCAVVGGAIPGLIAAFLGAVSACYFILLPRHSFAIINPEEQLGLALDLIVSVVLVLLAEAQRRSRLRARRSEEAERLERQRYEITLSSIGDGVIATDRDSRVTFINGVAAQLTGWTVGDALGRPIEEVFVIRNEDTGAPVENPAKKAVREGRVVALANHTVLIAKDGGRHPIDDSGAPIMAGGQVVGAVLVFRDISAARAQESELRKRARMIDLSHDAIIVVDRERRITSWNRGARELYGWDEEEARGQVVTELLHAHNGMPLGQVDEILLREGRWDGELIHRCKNGLEIVVESRHVLLRDLGEQPVGILEINRDVTARKHAEEELRRAAAEAEEGRRTLEAVMEHIPEGLVIADAPEVRIRMASRQAADMAGRRREELENLLLAEYAAVWGFHETDGKTPARPEDLPLGRAVRTGKPTLDQEWLLHRPDGETRVVLGKAAPIRDSEGRVTGGLVAWRDISERKRFEEKLREAAKLESLAVLAGGVAHDFNNLLTGVLGNASLLAESLPEGSSNWQFAQSITKAAQQAAKLSQQMLAYSGRGHFVVESVQLSRYVRRLAQLLESSMPKTVELLLDLEEDLPPIDADAAQIQQLLVNLTINAAEAVGDAAGRVTVTTRPVRVDEGGWRTRMGENLPPGDYVALEVTDTGCGMDEKTQARAFEPFFTTKFLGRGLGLAAVQGIVRGHKGGIQVESASGQGSTFRILFPVAAARGSAPTPAPGTRAERGIETVLVIDDEEVIRSTANQALRRLGYTVVTAADGAEGIEVFRAMKDRVAVVLLDLTMPGMSGEQTLAELRALRPDVAVVLSSGFAEAEALRRFGGGRLAGFLQKPYSVQTLAERVRSAAGRHVWNAGR